MLINSVFRGKRINVDSQYYKLRVKCLRKSFRTLVRSMWIAQISDEFNMNSSTLWAWGFGLDNSWTTMKMNIKPSIPLIKHFKVFFSYLIRLLNRWLTAGSKNKLFHPNNRQGFERIIPFTFHNHRMNERKIIIFINTFMNPI